MFPVFSLVLDKDVKSEVAMLYPELYKDLLKVFDKQSRCYSADEHNKQEQERLLLFSVRRVDRCPSRRS